MEKIKFDKAADVLGEDVLEELLEEVSIEPNMCHKNAALVGLWLEEYGFEVYFNAGYIGSVGLASTHSFNRVVVDGVSHFIDLTAEKVWEYDHPVFYDGNEYDIDYIINLFNEHEWCDSPIGYYYSKILNA